MSDFILDASILIQYVIADIHTTYVDTLFESVGDTITAHIPEFCLLECTNVLWKQVRFNNVPSETAIEHAKDLRALDLVIVPITDLLPRALEIGTKHQLAIYDSVYIAMAEQLGYPLITDDGKQAEAASAEAVTLKPITDFEP